MNTTEIVADVARLSDRDLLEQVNDLARREREATVALIAHLSELDTRRLYLAEGYPSLFKYCTDVLHLSEHAAYNRIEAARVVREFPVLLERLCEGSVTLATVRLLAPHLTGENHRALLDTARNKSKRDVEALVATLAPRPAVPTVVRKLPVSRELLTLGNIEHDSPRGESCSIPTAPPSSRGEAPAEANPARPSVVAASPARRPAIVALAPQRYKVQFTARAETVEKLKRVQALLRHQIPDGDLGEIVDRALALLLEQVARQKIAVTTRPGRSRGVGERSRRIPSEVKRKVWARDGGRCAFVSPNGRRCAEEAFLEFHHVLPFASGGPSTADNIELRCRAHNGYEAERCFGGAGTVVREHRPVY